MPTHLTVNLARECLPLIQDARAAYVRANPTSTPTDSLAIGYALDSVAHFRQKGGQIPWDTVMSSDFDVRLNLPCNFPHDIRYRTSIERTLVPRIDVFIQRELRPFFEGKIYRNFAIRAALRALHAIPSSALALKGLKNVAIDCDDNAPAARTETTV